MLFREYIVHAVMQLQQQEIKTEIEEGEELKFENFDWKGLIPIIANTSTHNDASIDNNKRAFIISLNKGLN